MRRRRANTLWGMFPLTVLLDGGVSELQPALACSVRWVGCGAAFVTGCVNVV